MRADKAVMADHLEQVRAGSTKPLRHFFADTPSDVKVLHIDA